MKDVHLMDVVTTYLYGSLDNDSYMKVPEGIKIPRKISIKFPGTIFNKVIEINIWIETIRTNVVQLPE